MANYLIIGGDGKEYGPVTDTDVRQWIAEGRLAASSLAKAESDAEFRPLANFPEFADILKQSPATIAPLKASAAGAAEFSEADYDLDIGGCIARGWELVKTNMNLLFVGTLLYLLIEVAIGGLSNIPLIGAVFSIANFVISGPLLGGVFYLFISAIRGAPVEIGDIFAGFRRAFGQLFLGTLLQGLLMGACMLPFLVVFLIKFIPLISHFQGLQKGALPDAETLAALKSILFATGPVLLLCAIPATYLSVCWKFTLPLIIDRQMEFWPAMKTSFKQVNRHWWQVFGLVIVIGLINLAGLLACCVGLLFTIPIGFAALMFAYETIFSGKKD